MTGLLEQLQHVLEVWGSEDEVEVPGAVSDPIELKHSNSASSQKNLFLTSVVASKGGSNNNKNGGDSGVRDGSIVLQAKKEYPQWLSEMESQNDTDNGRARHSNIVAPKEVHVSSLSKERITKLELTRAALSLFTSNSGIYQPILRKILCFLFGLVDELHEENMNLQKRGLSMQNERNHHRTVWSASDNAEVAAAHERMRMMEAHMAKLVGDAAKQRDNLKAEIAAGWEREAKLEGLLEHQMRLSHANAVQSEFATASSAKRRDAMYVKQLIARAEQEKAVDELQEEIETLLEERKQLNDRIQELKELNGRYAMQSVALAARLSILSEHNISSTIENQRFQNLVLLEKRQVEKYLRDLRIARNVVMATFVSRQHNFQRLQNFIPLQCSTALGEKALERLNAVAGVTPPPPPPCDSAEPVTSAKNSEESNKEKEPDENQPTATTDATTADVAPPVSGDTGTSPTKADAASDNKMLLHLWLPGVGNNLDTPEHLRSAYCVDYLRVNPLVADRVIHTLLTEWREQTTHSPLDVFTRDFLHRMMVGQNDGSPPQPPSLSAEEGNHTSLHQDSLPVAYALDALSRSGCCGALTYAFGLVTRGQLSEDIFYMMEFDCLLLLSICRYLDIERNAPYEPKGLIPLVQFASLLFAMYPLYPLSRLQQLVEVAQGEGGNRSESPVLLYYTVLLPERMFLGSTSTTVENAGSLWDTSFAHLFLKCICMDVEESWQLVHDSFHSFSKSCSVATEHQLIYEAFKEIPHELAHLWIAPLQAALTSWDELKIDKASVVLEGVPRVPVMATMGYLRKHTLLRRGTFPMSSEGNMEFLEELQQRWNKFSGGHGTLGFDRYTRLLKCLDPMRQAVWGRLSIPAGNLLRQVDTSVNITTNKLLELLLKEDVEGEEVKE